LDTFTYSSTRSVYIETKSIQVTTKTGNNRSGGDTYTKTWKKPFASM